MLIGAAVTLLALWLLAQLVTDLGHAGHALLAAALVPATAQRFREVGRRQHS